MYIKYLNINELNIDEISKHVSKDRIIRAEKFKFDSDKKRSIAVEYLLNEMLKELLEKDEEFTYTKNLSFPIKLKYDTKGKPHLYDELENDLIQFSLSHSGDYVACIISDKPCGVDIERHSNRPYDKIARRICADGEIDSIGSTKEFFDLWTLKESVLKAVGLGLSLDMRDFKLYEITEQEKIGNHTRVASAYKTHVDGNTYIGRVIEAPEGYSLSYIERVN